MALKKLDALTEIAKQKETRRMVVAAAADAHVLAAVKEAMDSDIVSPVLIGDAEKIKSVVEEIDMDAAKIEIVHEPDDKKACQRAVKLIREGKAEVLMKGLVATAVILKAVLDKEYGLRKGSTLSHFALFESPYYHKLLGVTDAAMNVAPEFKDKVAIVNNAVEAMRGIGVKTPKVAILGPVETVNPKIEST
ncbi:MAG: phosphate acyltransferase, partial [Bacteroidota bacterium]